MNDPASSTAGERENDRIQGMVRQARVRDKRSGVHYGIRDVEMNDPANGMAVKTMTRKRNS
jgi:hypothetical protein